MILERPDDTAFWLDEPAGADDCCVRGCDGAPDELLETVGLKVTVRCGFVGCCELWRLDLGGVISGVDSIAEDAMFGI